MIDAIRRFFDAKIDAPAAGRTEPEHAYRLATAALLMEITRADEEVTGEERDAVLDALRRAFSDLSADETEELLRLAEVEAEEATSLYQFTSLVNERFDERDKIRVVELLWHVAFADGDVDRYEEHLIRRIADLVHVTHADFIRGKLAAEAAAGSRSAP